MSDGNGITTATPPATERADELTALRAEIHELRQDVRFLTAAVRQASTRITHIVELQTPAGAEALSQALADRDAYRLGAQDLWLKLHPIDMEDFSPEKLVPVPPGTPDLLAEVLAELERQK